MAQRGERAQPAAQWRHVGSMPRATQPIVGSTATRVPTATGQSGPASITRPPISWPMTKGNAASVVSVGEGPVA